MNNFEELCAQMELHRMKVPKPKIQIRIEDSKEVICHMFNLFLREKQETFRWLREYDLVADWLSDNCGRGLFLYGNYGRGKSVLCRYVLPAILLKYSKRIISVFDVQEMNSNIDNVLSKHLISLDDIGVEEMSVKYGERRLAFAEVMDAAEKDGKLVIVSTNLTPSEIKSRYGERTLDRIKGLTTRVLFEGESLRK